MIVGFGDPAVERGNQVADSATMPTRSGQVNVKIYRCAAAMVCALKKEQLNGRGDPRQVARKYSRVRRLRALKPRRDPDTFAP